MKRLTTSGMALAIALAASSTSVFAQTQLENTVQNILTEYGYEVDASTLTNSQLTALTNVEDDAETNAEITAAIEGVLTPEFQMRVVEAPQLREQADQLFSAFDVDADPNRLSLNQARRADLGGHRHDGRGTGARVDLLHHRRGP